MTTLEILSLLFATAALFGLISSRWLRLPISIGTMLLTVLVSAGLIIASQRFPSIRLWAANLVVQIDFQSLVLHGMLPLLLFAGAFLLNLKQLAHERLPVSWLSVMGTGICFLLVAVLMSLLNFGHIPWIECLIFGALISPTDPIAVLEMLRRVGFPKGIQAQLAGESLFNDGIGAVLFLTMLEVARGQAPTPWHISGLLFIKGGGAAVVGIVAALVTSLLMRLIDAYLVDILFTLALAFGGYVLAEYLHLSAPLEAVVAGISLRYFNRGVPNDRIDHEQITNFWSVIDEIQNSVLFVLLGLETMAIALDTTTLRAGFTAILSVNLVRFAVVSVLLAFLRLFRPGLQSSALLLTWGGLRGGLSIALALSVPAELGRTWMLAATYVVVVFSVVIQGGSMNWFMRRNHAQAA